MSRTFTTVIVLLLYASIGFAQSNQPTMRIRVSRGVLCGFQKHTHLPSYPAQAIASGTHGDVEVRLIVGYDGTVKDAAIETGDSVLGATAVEAVRGWTFRPYVLHGAPAEVESSALFEFRLKKKKGKVRWNCEAR